VLAPQWMKIEAAFSPRGGITEKVTVQHVATM
jgi:7-cyano-7-deazaguanine reductase